MALDKIPHPSTVCTLAVLAILLPGCGGCTEETRVAILSPEAGAMLPAGAGVVATIQAPGDTILVDGAEVRGASPFTVTLAEVDGLGFVTAAIPGDPLIAVRSWHQGRYRAPGEFQGAAMAMTIGAGALGAGEAGVARLVADLLTGEELEGYVDEPLTFSVTIVVPVTVQVYVDSVVSPAVDVTLTLNEGALSFAARLHDVDIGFRAAAATFSVAGNAAYEWMDVSGGISLSVEGVTLTGVVTSHSDVVLNDVSGLPSQAVGPLSALLDGEISEAMVDAAQAAAAAVFTVLVEELRPEIGVAFPRPIVQETRAARLVLEGDTIRVGFDSRIVAATAAVAGPGHQVLERIDGEDAGASTGLAASAGSALVNPLAFALWDAGNFQGIHFSKGQLEELGMGELEFPYSNLRGVDVGLELPPLLEWTAEGPWLDLGGIEVHISVGGAEDSTAWTAGRVPVQLVLVGGALELQVDPARAVAIREVAFDRMSSLADPVKVLALLEAAVPGVVGSVFSALPALEVRPVTLRRLGGESGPTLQPSVRSVSARADTWLLDLELVRAP